METAAFHRIVTTFRKPLFATVARLTGTPAAVEPLVQDVFATAFHTLRDHRDVERQLLRIAVEKCIAYLRTASPPADRLAALKPDERALVVLHDIERRSLEDVCFVFRISPEMLSERLSIAYRRLLPAPETKWAPATATLGWKR